MIRVRLLGLILLVPSASVEAEERLNVLLFCIDDLRPELGCYGVDYIESPHIDAIAAGGRIFRHHYVQAPTCGASRYTLLTGRYGGSNNSALFNRASQLENDPESVPQSMPAWFRQHGYETVSVGKVSHHPGGWGGPDWDDETILEMPRSWDRHLLPAGPWQHPRGAMHGLAHGEIRKNAKDMAVFQAEEGPDSIYPDGLITDASIEELRRLAAGEKPFFLTVGIIRPHLPFGAPKKYLAPYAGVELPPIPHPDKPEHRTTWHKSGEFMKYQRWGRDPNEDAEFAEEVRRYYAACVTYADAQVGRVMRELEKSGKADSTVVVVWGDHGWHLGEHAVWGKHTLFEESLHSPLVIAFPGASQPGAATDAIVETLDVFPTVADLAGVPAPDFVNGRTLRPQLADPESPGRPAYGYFRKDNQTVRTGRYRLIRHGDGYVELYDHESEEGETRNVAEENPDVVSRLGALLSDRLGSVE